MTKIEITIKGKKLLLTVAQARAVRRDLNRLFGEPPEEEMDEEEIAGKIASIERPQPPKEVA